jgi:DNA-binding MarR family transcriptional regulator
MYIMFNHQRSMKMRTSKRPVSFRILYALRTRGSLRPIDLKKEVDCNRSTFYSTLARLRKKGYIQDINKKNALQRTVSITVEGIMVEGVMEEVEEVLQNVGKK